MKKYQRLFLTIISIISVVLFLIYRQQYNRLHHVLEVFNFFGTPCNISQLERSEGVRIEYDWGPLSVWQEVDSKWYIYNAFAVTPNKIQGITVKSNNKPLPKTCFIMYGDELKFKSGKLTAERFYDDKYSNMSAFIYTCNTTISKNPYSLALKAHSQPKFSSVLISNPIGNKINLNTTVCVFVNHFSKKALIEFLSFHNLLGIDSFIIYFPQNLPYSLIKLLKNFGDTLNIWFNFIPWNLPVSVPENFSSALIGKDCEFRAKMHAKYSLLLHLNEYIMPFDELYNKDSLIIPVKKICLNHVNKNRPIVLQNFESIDNYKYNEVRRIYSNNKKRNIPEHLSSIFDRNCVIYKYEKCPKGVKTKPDYAMKAYSTDLTRSTLVQLLINDSV